MQIGGPEALPFLKEYRAAQHEEMLGRRAGFEAEKSQLDAASKKLEYLGGITGTVRDQATLDLARQDVAQRAPGMERFFPAQYEPSQWAQFRHGLQTRKEQVAQAQAQERLGIEQQQAEIAQGRLGTEQRQTSVAEQRVAIERLQAEIAARKLDEFEYKDTPQGLVAVPKYGQPGGATTPQTVTTGSFERNRQELALHKEYNDRSKNYQEVRDAMGNIRASGASPTPAGDLSLVYAYIKMLDQRTGVRNEETRMAASTGGLPAEAQRWVEWAKGNQLLPDSVRKDFLERSSMLYDQYTKEYGDLARQYKEVATRQGLNPANVVLEYGTTTRRQAPTGVVTNADIDKTLANPANEGKSRQDIIEAFRTKGYRVPGD